MSCLTRYCSNKQHNTWESQVLCSCCSCRIKIINVSFLSDSIHSSSFTGEAAQRVRAVMCARGKRQKLGLQKISRWRETFYFREVLHFTVKVAWWDKRLQSELESPGKTEQICMQLIERMAYEYNFNKSHSTSTASALQNLEIHCLGYFSRSFTKMS